MDFDDLLGNDRYRRRDKHGPGYRDRDEHDRHDHEQRERYDQREDRSDHDDDRRWSGRREHGHHDDDSFDFEHLARRAFANKKLLIIAAVVLVVVLVLAAIFILPLLGHGLDYIDKSGVKGVIDRLWQGSGGGK